MQPSLSLACFLSVIRPPGVQFEDALLQILPVDKAKCPFVKDRSDIGFRLFTRHNPTVHQELRIDDDEALFASNFDFHDPTVIFFGAFMEQSDDGSGLMVRQSYMLRGRTNFIILDISRLEAGPWYFTAAENTWYIGNYAAKFIDYMVTRGLSLNTTHLVGHSLGGQSAGVAGSAIKSGKVSRITGLDPALPLFAHLPLAQRLDPSDGEFVDIIHTDAGIFGYKSPIGHADFYPNGGISPQPGCELEVVLHEQRLLNKCEGNPPLQGFYVFHLTPHKDQHTFINKLLEFFTYITNLSDLNTETSPKETSIRFKDNIEDLRKSNPKLANERKDKLAKLYYDKRSDFKDKSVLINKLRTIDDEETNPQYNEDVTQRTETHMLETKEPFENKENETIFEAEDSIALETSFKREKRTNNDVNNFTDNKALMQDTENNTDYIKNENNSTHINKQATIEIVTTSLHEANPTDYNDTTTAKDVLITTANDKQENLHDIKQIATTPIADKQIPIDATLQTTDDLKTTKLQRQKRFISLFKNNNENDNFLFKILEFLMKNRKNVIPVVTVMREINTLVKSASGELNHISKERNNYIGAIPTLTPIKYDLELGESGVITFIKRLIGLAPKGGRLSISET